MAEEEVNEIGDGMHILNLSYINFKNDSHESALLKEMKKLFDEDLLKDVTLCVGNLEFGCHKNVLAATSPYFKLMFTLEMAESKKDRIELFEIDSRSLKEIIEYAYTGKVRITRRNAQNLLSAATLFQILPVQRACAKFMETQLDINNCIGINFIAEIHNCTALKIKAREFIEKNFVEVCGNEEFLSLTFNKLAEIVMSDELNVEKEEIVLDAVISWVEHDFESRKVHFCDILQMIRIGLLSKRYVKEILAKHKLVKECKKCKEYIKDLKDYETNPGTYVGENEFSLSLRSGMYHPEGCLLIIGGVELTSVRPCINCFNPVSQECFYIEEFPEPRKQDTYDCEDVACVVTGDNLIFAGGGNYIYHHLFEDSEDDSFEELEYKEYIVQKDFYQYDMDHNEWIAKSPMLFPKSNFTLASLNGKVYCFGGLTENKHPTEIIEVYDIERNRWNYQGMLPTTLVDLASVVFNENIYLLGGRTGVGAHNSLIRYNPETEEWTSLAGMLTPRFNFGACIHDGEIFAAGGQIYSHASYTINREVLRTVEVYNIEANQWRLGPELPVDMFNVGLCVINGAMYACGTPEYEEDLTSQRSYNAVCRLDLGTNTWEMIEESLCSVRNFRCVMAKMHTRKLQKVFSSSCV
ncbi:kelch-like protein 3 [Ruditapes philippinarum]|uniref:kelch-like protein 3 n=1 Tax=Ruditapes philippinarum TaxID=129788 RepID=UPI00295B4EB3|nr:kelch-like protein 3 [Ruditapes philippinarum]XP_060571919.1 kelch-like protein 3 [Ruditapes philippinarum]